MCGSGSLNNITITLLFPSSVVDVSFTQAVYTGIESNLSVTVCVFIAGALERDVEVGVITANFVAEGIFLTVCCAA